MIEFKVSKEERRDTFRMTFGLKRVQSIELVNPSVPSSIGILVLNAGASNILCPFFGKCDGLLVIDRADGKSDLLPNGNQKPDALCDLIIRSGLKSIVCGFIGESEKRKLRSNGIDIRLGSCTCSVEELIANFDTLEVA